MHCAGLPLAHRQPVLFLALLAWTLLPAAGRAATTSFPVDSYDASKACDGTTLFNDASNAGEPRVVEVDMQGTIQWQYFLPDELKTYTDPGFDVEYLPVEDHILLVFPRHGIIEIDREGNEHWSHLDASVSHDADRLSTGNTLYVFGCNDTAASIHAHEVTPTGDTAWSWMAATDFNVEPYASIEAEGWTHANAVVRMSDGRTLINLRNFNISAIVAADGTLDSTIDWKAVSEGKSPLWPHEPEVQPHGNVLIALQAASPYQGVEIDGESHAMVWSYGRDGLRTTRDCDRLPNGNTLFVSVIEAEECSVIFEVTPAGEIVWQLKSDTRSVGTEPGWFYKAERIPAATATTFSLHGTINRSAAAVEGAWVDLFDSSGAWKAHVQSDSDGRYSFSELAAGTYSVRAYDSANQNAATDYSKNPVTLSTTSVLGVNIAFSAAYSIYGAVTQGGTAVSGAWLDLFDSDGTWLANTQTDGNGQYSFGPIASGGYKLTAYDPVTLEATAYTDNPVTLTDANVTGVVIALPASYTLTGAITQGGSAVSGGWVDLFEGGGTWVANAQTDTSGQYSLSGVAAGTYAIRAYDPVSLQPTAYGGNPVTVTADASGLDIDLPASYTLSGSITQSGAAVSGAWVDLFQGDGTWVANAQTAASGTYSLGPVPSGTYLVKAYDPVTLAATSYTGNPVTLASANASGLDVALSATYSVSGTVRQDGAALAGAWLDIFTTDGCWLNHAQTGTDGTYTLNNINAGTCNVTLYEPGSTTPIAYEGNPITINSDVTGIDFAR